MTTRNDRQRWTDAVWESDLAPNVRLVALAFARYASRGLDSVWLAQSHLCEITGLSKPTAQKATRVLLDDGWLEVVEPPRQRRAARYRLTFSGQPVCPLDQPQRSTGLPPHDPIRGQTDSTRGQTQPSQGSSGVTRTLNKNPRKNPHPADGLALALAITPEEARQWMRVSSSDPETIDPVARLRASAAHRLEVQRVLRAEDRTEQQRQRATAAKCRDCGLPVTDCDRANDGLPTIDRCNDHNDRQQAAGPRGTAA